jgi:hypothetical protein
MNRARRPALFFLLAAALAAAAIAFLTTSRGPAMLPPRPAPQRPSLLLLTSLPLLFGEDFSLQGSGSPALKQLEMRYRIVPISVTDKTDLGKGGLLLMAQPPAQTAENLVILDAWVRGGGRVLLLADPLLEWPSKRPLGDPLRPPPMFTDTGLLAHWGLRLDTPAERGPAMRELGGFQVLTISPGRLEGEGRCSTGSDALVAHCRIGIGRATVVADADLLDVNQLGPKARENLDGLIAELATLEEK